MSSSQVKIVFGPNLTDIYQCCLAAAVARKKVVPVSLASLGKPVTELPTALVGETLLVSASTICRYLLPDMKDDFLDRALVEAIEPLLHDLSIASGLKPLQDLDSSLASVDFLKISESTKVLFSSIFASSFTSNFSNYAFVKENYQGILSFYEFLQAKDFEEAQAKVSLITSSFVSDMTPEAFPVLTMGYPLVRSLSKFFNAATVEAFPFVGQGVNTLLEEGKAMKKNQIIVPDFQYSVALKVFGLLKSVKGAELKQFYGYSVKSPRDVATIIVQRLESCTFLSNVVDKYEVSGPGFINVYLKASFRATQVEQVLTKKVMEPSAITASVPNLRWKGSYYEKPRDRVSIDMSSPNVAKEMHVGHLRSTVLGEVISRVLRHRGHTVLKINHIGDWGTQFGMLLTYLGDLEVKVSPGETSLTELNVIYKKAKKRFDEDEDFKTRSREAVVRLQRGDEWETETWKKLIAISETGFEEIYKRLDVVFEDGNCGESFYQSRIPACIAELRAKGVLEDYEGAKIVTTSVCKVPLFIQKSDGGFGYDTTDMTALAYRIRELNCNRLLYVCDLGQTNHFESVFEVGRRIGLCDKLSPGPEFVGFGVVCGKDGKRFRSRSGETVSLRSLLDEAKSRIKLGLEERLASGDTSLTEEEIDDASARIGYSAIKFFDLRNSREKDYIFDYDQMIQPTGNTGVYVIYTYARICSIERKIASLLGLEVPELVSTMLREGNFMISPERAKEWEIAKVLMRYGDTMQSVEQSLQPHLLCTMVYDICVSVSKFYAEHQLIVRDPLSPSGKNLDPKHGLQWVFLLTAAKKAIEETSALIGIQLLERI